MNLNAKTGSYTLVKKLLDRFFTKSSVPKLKVELVNIAAGLNGSVQWLESEQKYLMTISVLNNSLTNEITAIVCHEVGHIVLDVEKFGEEGKHGLHTSIGHSDQVKYIEKEALAWIAGNNFAKSVNVTREYVLLARCLITVQDESKLSPELYAKWKKFLYGKIS
jgi:hypothetical protein